jgi:hypothetical protein
MNDQQVISFDQQSAEQPLRSQTFTSSLFMGAFDSRIESAAYGHLRTVIYISITISLLLTLFG